MGYSFNKELHVGCSDSASDFFARLAISLVREMERQERVEENNYNTDGILNVAMVLQDCFNSEEWKYTQLIDTYLKNFVPRFKKWIGEKEKQKWNDEGNKTKHLQAYRKILNNLKMMIKKEKISIS